MSNNALIITATIICLICGALASATVVINQLEGVHSIIASLVGIVCLPVGSYMAYLSLLQNDLSD